MTNSKEIKSLLSSNLGKFIIGILLAILLLIPMQMVQDLILERKMHHEEVATEISNDWGGQQTLKGPFLEVPYQYIKNKSITDTSKVLVRGTAILLAETINIEGNIEPSYKNRGIYKFVVYDSDFNINGAFNKPNIKLLQAQNRLLKEEHLQWDKAKLSFYISEIKGLTNNVKINWNNKKSDVIPASKIINKAGERSLEGFSCNVNYTPGKSNNFSFKLKLKGSKEINFIPLGKFTEIHINSPWASPKFTGNYLPDSRKVTDDGFNANWNISQLNRPVKQAWLSHNTPNLSKYTFGVQLLEPVDKYLKTLRAAKYSILFITLSFLTLFFVEIFTKKDNNILQYVLTGLALALFYSILLSLTEQMSFNKAYFISSSAIIGLITAYSYSLSKNFKSSLILFSLWSILYGFLFSILQLEEYALLVGNIGLFVILAVIMFTSKKLNINATEKENNNNNITVKKFSVDNGDML